MNRKVAERSLERIASEDLGLSRLLELARGFEALDARLQARLPESMRGHVRLACIEGECLVLAAASPAWASRARLTADELLAEANRHVDGRLARTRVIVVPQLGR